MRLRAWTAEAVESRSAEGCGSFSKGLAPTIRPPLTSAQ
jgi:hypothetical protein